MKSKDLIVGVVAIAVIVGGLGLILKSSSPKKGAAKTALTQKAINPSAKAAPAKAIPVKKTFSKDMGGLTVQILDCKSKAMSVSVKSFRAVDSRSGVYTNSFVTNRMQELAPGSYDIELNTVPQRLYKGISVSNGRETVENLGCVTGILNVKMVDAKGKASQTPLKIYQAKTNILVAAASANRPVELLAGVYDIEIGVLPKSLESAVTIEAGKEKALDLGVMTGTLIVKAVDENKVEKKDARQSVKIKRSDTNELVTSVRVNSPVEIRPGTYTVEIGTVPPQVNKDIKVTSGAEAVVEVIIQTPPQVKAQPAPAAVPGAVPPAKGK